MLCVRHVSSCPGLVPLHVWRRALPLLWGRRSPAGSTPTRRGRPAVPPLPKGHPPAMMSSARPSWPSRTPPRCICPSVPSPLLARDAPSRLLMYSVGERPPLPPSAPDPLAETLESRSKDGSPDGSTPLRGHPALPLPPPPKDIKPLTPVPGSAPFGGGLCSVGKAPPSPPLPLRHSISRASYPLSQGSLC